ncbi:uncharacterized protein [Prorops nasuta]|uniref:uncharacterized protein n=1 Tax=Prorops nasuta TaxID=863751 RepID=UPI0034CF7C3B
MNINKNMNILYKRCRERSFITRDNYVIRKKSHVHFEGFEYHIIKKYKNSNDEYITYFRCKDRMCSGRGKKVGDSEMIVTKEHNMHEADDKYLKVAKLRENAFQYAQSSLITPREVYTEMCQNFPDDVLCLSFNEIKHSLRKWCQLSRPPLPTNIFEVDIILNLNDIWKQLLNFNSNGINYKLSVVKYVDEADRDSISIVFGVKKFSENILKDATCFYADATFQTKPDIDGAYQLLTIMTKRYEKHPAVLFEFTYIATINLDQYTRKE